MLTHQMKLSARGGAPLRLQSDGDGDDPKQSSSSSAYVVVLHLPRRSQCFVPLSTPPSPHSAPHLLCVVVALPLPRPPAYYCVPFYLHLCRSIAVAAAAVAVAVDVAPLGFAVANNE